MRAKNSAHKVWCQCRVCDAVHWCPTTGLRIRRCERCLVHGVGKHTQENYLGAIDTLTYQFMNHKGPRLVSYLVSTSPIHNDILSPVSTWFASSVFNLLDSRVRVMHCYIRWRAVVRPRYFLSREDDDNRYLFSFIVVPLLKILLSSYCLTSFCFPSEWCICVFFLVIHSYFSIIIFQGKFLRKCNLRRTFSILKSGPLW